MIETEVVGLTDAMTARNTMTEIRDTAVIGGGMTGMAEVGITETAGQDQGRRGGRNRGTGTMEDGDGLERERGMMVTRTNDDGQTTEQST